MQSLSSIAAAVPREGSWKERFRGDTLDELLNHRKFLWPRTHPLYALALHSDIHHEMVGEYRAKVMVGQRTYLPPMQLMNNPQNSADIDNKYDELVTAGQLHGLLVGANRPNRMAVFVSCVHDAPTRSPNFNQPRTNQPHTCVLEIIMNAPANAPQAKFFNPRSRRLRNGLPNEVNNFLALMKIGQGRAVTTRGTQRWNQQNCYTLAWKEMDRFVNEA